jgi:hypothetical protein
MLLLPMGFHRTYNEGCYPRRWVTAITREYNTTLFPRRINFTIFTTEFIYKNKNMKRTQPGGLYVLL